MTIKRISDGRIVPESEILKIDKVTAYVAVDPDDRTEGIVPFYTGNGLMPMIGADEEMIKRLRPVAEDMAQRIGTKVSLIQFSNREVLVDDILAEDDSA